ncbi:MAG: DNA-binding protein WhiA [Clostridia bacterium]
MSFSSQVKDEISRISLDDKCCLLCELAAIIRIGGRLSLQKDGYYQVSLSTENASLARRIFINAIHAFDFHPSVITKKSRKLKKHNLYILVMKGSFATRMALGDMGLVEVADGIGLYNPIESITGNDCCTRSYLRGAFMIGGSLSQPEKGYHLEMVSANQKEITDIVKMMGKFGIRGKVIVRRNMYVCYIKESENIVDFLNVIGAHNALMQYENVRIIKDMRNHVNRAVNCETANLGKTVNTAYRQMEAIRLIDKVMGIETLPQELQAVALLRMNHPDASLQELGKLMVPALGKSGINHRLRKMEEIAENLKNRKK